VSTLPFINRMYVCVPQSLILSRGCVFQGPARFLFCMCVCVYVCIYACICVCMTVFVYACMHVSRYVWKDLFMRPCLFVCIHACRIDVAPLVFPRIRSSNSLLPFLSCGLPFFLSKERCIFYYCVSFYFVLVHHFTILCLSLLQNMRIVLSNGL